MRKAWNAYTSQEGRRASILQYSPTYLAIDALWWLRLLEVTEKGRVCRRNQRATPRNDWFLAPGRPNAEAVMANKELELHSTVDETLCFRAYVTSARSIRRWKKPVSYIELRGPRKFPGYLRVDQKPENLCQSIFELPVGAMNSPEVALSKVSTTLLI